MKLEASLGKVATQVAHDIRSPLAALEIFIKNIVNIPERERLLIRNASNQIHNIANNLLTHYKTSKTVINNGNKKLEINPELIVEVISSLISAMVVQYQNSLLSFKMNIHKSAYGIFVNIPPSEFKRAISNLVNNAIDSMNRKGTINVGIFINKNDVDITIQDEGCGISSDLLEKIMVREIRTEKKDGHGLGLSYAIKIVEDECAGKFKIQSSINEGTKISITIPTIASPSWYVPKLVIPKKLNVIILDDDESIHDVWRSRFDAVSPDIQYFDFYQTQQLTDLKKVPE